MSAFYCAVFYSVGRGLAVSLSSIQADTKMSTRFHCFWN